VELQFTFTGVDGPQAALLVDRFKGL